MDRVRIALVSLVFICASSQCLGAADDDTRWTTGTEVAYPFCEKLDRTVAVHVGIPPDPVLSRLSVLQSPDKLVPSPEAFCVERIWHPDFTSDLAVWYFRARGPGTELSRETTIVLKNDLVVPLELPDREEVFRTILRDAGVWPRSEGEAETDERTGEVRSDWESVVKLRTALSVGPLLLRSSEATL